MGRLETVSDIETWINIGFLVSVHMPCNEALPKIQIIFLQNNKIPSPLTRTGQRNTLLLPSFYAVMQS
jgi:hypothetical protein